MPPLQGSVRDAPADMPVGVAFMRPWVRCVPPVQINTRRGRIHATLVSVRAARAGFGACRGQGGMNAAPTGVGAWRSLGGMNAAPTGSGACRNQGGINAAPTGFGA